MEPAREVVGVEVPGGALAVELTEAGRVGEEKP